jgi:hypothetical protein
MRDTHWLKRGVVLLTILAAGTFGALMTQAGYLEAPTVETCEYQAVGDILSIDWSDVSDEDGNPVPKYSVDAKAGYDTDGDGTVDIDVEFSFGTSDREDGRDMSSSDLDIPYEAFLYEVVDETTGESLQYTPGEIEVKVKALNPGQGKGPQNHPFSTWFTCTL